MGPNSDKRRVEAVLAFARVSTGLLHCVLHFASQYMLQRLAVCCRSRRVESVLAFARLSVGVLQGALQCVAEYCSVLQCFRVSALARLSMFFSPSLAHFIFP